MEREEIKYPDEKEQAMTGFVPSIVEDILKKPLD